MPSSALLFSLEQGWIVTFLRELGGSTAIGYAATGFWLGIAAGKPGLFTIRVDAKLISDFTYRSGTIAPLQLDRRRKKGSLSLHPRSYGPGIRGLV